MSEERPRFLEGLASRLRPEGRGESGGERLRLAIRKGSAGSMRLLYLARAKSGSGAPRSSGQLPAPADLRALRFSFFFSFFDLTSLRLFGFTRTSSPFSLPVVIATGHVLCPLFRLNDLHDAFSHDPRWAGHGRNCTCTLTSRANATTHLHPDGSNHITKRKRMAYYRSPRLFSELLLDIQEVRWSWIYPQCASTRVLVMMSNLCRPYHTLQW